MTTAHHNSGVASRGLPPVALYDDIACNPKDPLPVFYPESRKDTAAERAKRICRRCPHEAECLDWALETGQDEGVWGATTPAERRKMLKTTPATAS